MAAFFRVCNKLVLPEFAANGDEEQIPELGLSKWDYSQNLPFGASGDHRPNICIEIGARANRGRARGCLYVWETAFTVQRALCTFIGKGHPMQRALGTFMDKGTMAPI